MTGRMMGAAIAAVTLAVAAPAAAAESAGGCELHFWPTENYLGIQTGLLSGFGMVGAITDMAAHDGRVKSVKDLMRDYLGPDVQMDELRKADFAAKLGLTGDWTVIVEEPTPWNEDFKAHPELKARAKAMNATIKAGKRLSASATPCYAELVGTHIFYHKAMMYGSNLFAGWNFRRFDGARIVAQGVGQVKNPLEDFPPKADDKIEAAKIELRDAYARDFAEFVTKKVTL